MTEPDNKERELRIELMRAAAIYEIRNIVSGRVYVGSAINPDARWRVHRCVLRKGTHHSMRLQRSWNKHGPEAFKFAILELISRPDELPIAEQRWIDALYASCPRRGFNILPRAFSAAGRVFSQATIEKMSQSRRGKPLTASHRAAVGLAMKGRKLTAAHKLLISKRHAGKVVSLDTVAKLTGRKLPPLSDAHKALISKRQLGIPRSLEVRMKISQSLTGRKRGPMSDSHKAKISAAKKARFI